MEDLLKLSRSFISLALLSLLCQAGSKVPAFLAQEAPKPSKSQPRKPAPAPGRVWKSKTSGKEFRVWTEKGSFHAEWANIPPEFASKGAYIRSVWRRAGQKWMGESRSYLPCTAGEGKEEHIANFCHVSTEFEVDSMTDSRLTGRGEALKRFDCSKCQVLEKEWRSFVWVPKQ